MLNQIRVQGFRLERILVVFFGLSVFLSKSGIYAASALLVLYFLVRSGTDRNYRQYLLGHRLAVFGVALYVGGLIATIIYPGHLEDVSWYARKGAFLLILPPLLHAFRDPIARQATLIALFVGFWIAFFYTMNEIGWTWSGERVAGPWPVDPWSVLLAMFVAFLVPLVSLRGLGVRRIFPLLTLLAAVVLLIMSGSRGPWLGAMLASLVFLFVYQPRALVVVVLLAFAISLPMQANFGVQWDRVQDRVKSISDVENQGNWIRLKLWELSVRHSLDGAKNEPVQFLVGRGPINNEKELLLFYQESEFFNVEEKRRLHPYPSNDAHNMYLDSLAKMGIIWTGLVLVWMLSSVFSVSRGVGLMSGSRQSAVGVLIVYLIVGMFYSILPHFVTFALVLFVVLAVSHRGRESGVPV